MYSRSFLDKRRLMQFRENFKHKNEPEPLTPFPRYLKTAMESRTPIFHTAVLFSRTAALAPP